MISTLTTNSSGRLKPGLLVFLAALLLAAPLRAGADANLTLWDTGSRLGSDAKLGERTGWKQVPGNLFTLEADPAKAASDPGYYGRDYAFTGDAAVSNNKMTVVFRAASSQVVILSKDNGNVAVLEPMWAVPGRSRIDRYEVVRNAGDEVVLRAIFSSAGAAASALFTVGKSEIVEVTPDAGLKYFRVSSPLDYGVAPSFIGDDLVFDPSMAAPSGEIAVAAENLFLGLVRGGNDMLVMTWPKGGQRLSLHYGKGVDGKPGPSWVGFAPDGQSFYLAPLHAPGIWHREELKPGYLEKDVPSQWKRPFPARWVTQLSEAGVRTTFTLKESKGTVWRGVPGSYSYPVWFDRDGAVYHLSKKVPPKGESVIYFREGENTPSEVSTPVDILRETLGRQMCERILDPVGRKLRTHHRRGGDGVHRACTCGCTEAIQAVFEAGEETTRKDYIAGALDDMVYFVKEHLARIDEYRRFSDDMVKLLREKGASSPELKEYAAGLEQIAGQISQEYNVQLENMKSLAYADDLKAKTMALADRKDPKNLAAYMNLLKDWRAMGGAQDYIVAQCHAITRKLQQEAGYAAAPLPSALALALEVRERCRQCLRNADGYEIWPNY